MNEDLSLTCSDCGQEFAYTAAEQKRFEAKGFQPPKRCPNCRKAKRQRQKRRGRGQGDGVYRSPAFADSAPRSQARRSRHQRGPSGGGGPQRGRGEYRSPAFRDLETRGEGMYRSPAFRDGPTDGPTGPGPTGDAAEYRAPGFRDAAHEYRDERPLFLLECASCGDKSMVPFLPDERENPLCERCEAAASGEETGENTAGDDESE